MTQLPPRSGMTIKSVYILNKAGGLIFQRDYSESLQKLDDNGYLSLASTLHSVHALSSKISPTGKSSGFNVVEMPTSSFYCFQTLTGVKFFILTDHDQFAIAELRQQLYQLYSDYVMKNPFYTPDMPIRSVKFDRSLDTLVRSSA